LLLAVGKYEVGVPASSVTFVLSLMKISHLIKRLKFGGGGQRHAEHNAAEIFFLALKNWAKIYPDFFLEKGSWLKFTTTIFFFKCVLPTVQCPILRGFTITFISEVA
jgi:hypothetical protein